MKKIFAVVILSGSLLWTQQAAAWIPVVVNVVNAVATVVRSCSSNVASCTRVVTSIVSIGGVAYSYSAKAEARVNSAIAENKRKTTLFKCPNSNTSYAPEEVSEHCKTAEVVDVDL
ncbi:MAG: hypothetical protein RIS84_563 [Pseudomonadota bacterium]|jgi:hypothetical protein